MNIQAHETNRQVARTRSQAQELATLTRALSHCCLDKEERICRTFGLHPADGRVLAAMLRENLCTSTEVAEHLGIGNSRITPLIDRLAKKGLVIRTESGHDRRIKRLELTASGHSVALSIQEFETELHVNLLNHFAPVRRKELLIILDDLKVAMDSVRSSIES